MNEADVDPHSNDKLRVVKRNHDLKRLTVGGRADQDRVPMEIDDAGFGGRDDCFLDPGVELVAATRDTPQPLLRSTQAGTWSRCSVTQRCRVSGATSAPLGQTIVPSSSSTSTRAK